MDLVRLVVAVVIGIVVAIVFGIPQQTQDYAALLGVLAGVAYYFSGIGARR